MKVLTLHQPWASLVILGLKKLETRGWSTRHRGELAIHASANRRSLIDYYKDMAFNSALASRFHIAVTVAMKEAFPNYPLYEFPVGEILGTVELVEVYKEFPPYVLTEREALFGLFGVGRKLFELKNPIPFAMPIPAVGALGLWNWSADSIEGGNNGGKRDDTQAQ